MNDLTLTKVVKIIRITYIKELFRKHSITELKDSKDGRIVTMEGSVKFVKFDNEYRGVSDEAFDLSLKQQETIKERL